MIGSGGKNLADVWANEPKSYLGVAAHDFPNYLMVIGPNSPIGMGLYSLAWVSVVFSSQNWSESYSNHRFAEAQVDYILRLVNRWQTENIHSFTPKLEAVEDFIAFKDEFMKSTVWESGCRSWYKSGSISGKVTALWPGSTLHYLESIADPRYEDWDFKYIGNRFASSETADHRWSPTIQQIGPTIFETKMTDHSSVVSNR